MPIGTVRRYTPKHSLPLYSRVVLRGHNDWTVGEKYDMRVEDPDRQEEKGGRGPYNYTHEALLVGKEEMVFGDVPRILLAFDAHSQKKSECMERTFPSPEKVDGDTEVTVLFLLRLDKTKEFILSDLEVIDPPFKKEDTEGNG